MAAHDVIAVATTATALAMAVSPALQMRRMVQTGSSESVSVGYFSVLCVGFVMWVAYGVSIDSKVVAGCNFVSLVFALATIATALIIRRRGVSGV